MEFTTKTEAVRLTGVTYLGSVSKTTKHIKSIQYNEMTYALYLAPAKMSGYEVCPMRTKECTDLCLNESGHNKIGYKEEMINKSRITKTKLFFEHRQFFVDWLIYEIGVAKRKAESLGYSFSVRLNNTSDINPISFYTNIDGKKKNILQIFNDVQFYDYSKVHQRLALTYMYENYHLTYSYSGDNMERCVKMLQSGINVAMVFKNVPSEYMGYEVINGDKFDMRYLDKSGVIVGLKFKKVRKKLDSNVKFVIQ